jgi:hypothetical protein
MAEKQICDMGEKMTTATSGHKIMFRSRCYGSYGRTDRLCDLVIRVPGCRSRRSGFASRRCCIFREILGLNRVPLSLETITEKLLERQVAAPVYNTEIDGR